MIGAAHEDEMIRSEGASEIEATILALEAERCRALVQKDLQALRQLLAERLIHVHASGVTEDRDAYLATVANKLDFLVVERGELSLHAYSGAVVVSGPLRQTVRVRASGEEADLDFIVTQLWVDTGGTWRQASFQATAAKRK